MFNRRSPIVVTDTSPLVCVSDEMSVRSGAVTEPFRPLFFNES